MQGGERRESRDRALAVDVDGQQGRQRNHGRDAQHHDVESLHSTREVNRNGEL